MKRTIALNYAPSHSVTFAFGAAIADYQIVAIAADFSSISADGVYITFTFWQQILRRWQHHKEQ